MICCMCTLLSLAAPENILSQTKTTIGSVRKEILFCPWYSKKPVAPVV